jgi:type I restriction enzyme S subunit
MKNWEKKKLGEVCIVERGSSPRPIEKYQTDSPDGVNWIKIGDTKGVDKYIFSTREKITKEGAKKSRYVKEGDFILSNSMSFGKPYIMKTDGYIHDGWFVFRLPDYLDKDYFYHLLTSPNVQEQIQSLGAGAIVKNISGDLVKKVDITFPKSLSEQQRIVAILDEAFAAIAKAKANAEQNLKNAKELFESYLQGVFENKGEGWEEKTLGEMIEIKNGKNQQAVLSETGEYKIMGSAGNVMGYATDFICEAGTTIIGRKGNISKPLYINERFWNVDTAFGFYPKNEKDIDKRLVYYLCLGIDFKSMNRGTTIPSLVKSELQTIKICFPKSLKAQQAIVKKLDTLIVETQKLESNYIKKLNDLEELKKSVLQKAFSGELKTEKEVTV